MTKVERGHNSLFKRLVCVGIKSNILFVILLTVNDVFIGVHILSKEKGVKQSTTEYGQTWSSLDYAPLNHSPDPLILMNE